MDIQIKNFKGITNFKYNNVSPLTILSGVNSGGKTSFIQSLLMLKQSYEQGEEKRPIVLNGKYAKLGSFRDALNQDKKDLKKDIEIEFVMHKKDFSRRDLIHLVRSVYLSSDREQVRKQNLNKEFTERLNKVIVSYKFNTKMKNKVVLPVRVNYSVFFEGIINPIFLEFQQSRMYKYIIKTNSNFFIKSARSSNGNMFSLDNPIFSKDYQESHNIYFDQLLPSFGDRAIWDESDNKIAIRLAGILSRKIFDFLEKISYLGPLRDEPHSLYIRENDIVLDIGIKGEHTGNIFSNNYLEKVEYPVFNKKNELDTVQGILEDGVNYWINEVFELAKKISVIPYKNGRIQEIEVTNYRGVKSSLSSVGFGISQILPIIVEGILCERGTTLILEQPEIHLHPRIQSLLFDFFRGLILCDKKVIVETHSDHLISKMQLRIAEDVSDSLSKKINLFFVDNFGSISSIEIDKFGNFDSWPEGFFDQFNNNISALLEAQIARRKNDVYN